MSTLCVSFFSGLAVERNGHVVQIPQLPALTSQKVAFTATHGAIANGAPADAEFAMITVDAAAYFAAAPTPVAVADGTFLAISSEQQLFYGIPKGEAIKISAIAR